MDILKRVPYHFSEITEFFIRAGNFFYRDFQELQSIFQKSKFVSRGVNRFQREAEKYESAKIFFDGEKFFSRGFPLAALVALEEKSFLVHEPLHNIFYWYHNGQFFLNGSKIQYKSPLTENASPLRMSTDSLPLSILCMRFFSGALDMISVNESTFDFFLKDYSFVNGFYVQKELESHVRELNAL